MFQKRTVLTWTFFAVMVMIGCDSKTDSKPVDKKDSKPAEATKKVDDHSGWWCDEHGIKESECSMCSPKVAKAFQAKGDWCKEHNRAKSQCFICDPKLKEKFAEEFVAKYGKQPPEPEGQLPDNK